MKTTDIKHIFDHPWETIVQAVFRKYPNPYKPEVTGAHVVERKVEKNILVTERIITSKWGFPDWCKKIVGNNTECFAHEVSEVDPTTQSMSMCTKNLSLSNILLFSEKLVYKPCPEDRSKTVMEQKTEVSVFGVPLSSFLENYLISKVPQNCYMGRHAMEHVVSLIDKEVEDLVSSYKKTQAEILTSFDDMTSSAKKSIDQISTSIKSMENKPSPVTRPRI